mmetsp:Transcript_14868/g.32424  ORF Transcript_14868/g.32424 Transcript_14868/m.32424 type:complete len:223 (-) Transcript_14868:22-690(-)
MQATDFNMLLKMAASLSGTSLNSLRMSLVVGLFPLEDMRRMYFLIRINKPLYFFVSGSCISPEVAALPLDDICILLFCRLASSEPEEAILFPPAEATPPNCFVSSEPVQVGSNLFWFSELSFRASAAFIATLLAFSSISTTDRGFLEDEFSTKSWLKTPQRPLLFITVSNVSLLSTGCLPFSCSFASSNVFISTTPPPFVISPVSVTSLVSALRVNKSFKSF